MCCSPGENIFKATGVRKFHIGGGLPQDLISSPCPPFFGGEESLTGFKGST